MTLRVMVSCCIVSAAAGLPGCGTEPYCGPPDEWPTSAAVAEAEVLRLTNEARGLGADCRTHGVFPAAAALTVNAALQCAARNHSLDMASRGFTAHENPDGDSGRERIGKAGYDWSAWGENIAWGHPSAARVVEKWLASDGHCAVLMKSRYEHLGVGHVAGDAYEHSTYWTQVFGDPG